MKNIQYCQKNKGLELYAYVIMSNHLHLIGKSNGNHSIELWSTDMIKKMDYLHNSPVKQGIVANPQDYFYSSAYEFSELKVLVL